MAAVVRFVNTASTSGGDGTTNATTGANRAYPTLAAWDAAEATDLVAAGDTHEVQCDGGADTTTVSLVGWTSSTTNTLTVKPNANSAHAGKLDTGKYHLAAVSNYDVALTASTFHTEIDGLQFSQTSGMNIAAVVANAAAVSGRLTTVKNCIIKGNNAAGTNRAIRRTNNGNNHFYNNIIYDWHQGIRTEAQGTTALSDCAIYNNTIEGCGTNGIRLDGTGQRIYVKNNLLDNDTTDYLQDATPNATTATNNTSDATSPDGAGHQSIVTTFTDLGGEDYSTSDSDVVGQGTDLSADGVLAFSTDILGNSRPGGAWDIGAFQNAGASSSGVITGTAEPAALESEIVVGDETTIITLSDDTWVADGATFDAQRQAIIAGADSAEAEVAGWNAEVRDKEDVTAVVRTSDTVVTITWSAAAAYKITANETITVTIPAAALVTSGIAVVATPTFVITNETPTIPTGIPSGFFSIANCIKDPDFIALMRAEANDIGVWASWNAGVDLPTLPIPKGTANLNLNLTIIKNEANGSATWARWAPDTQPGNTGNLQLNMRTAITNDFGVTNFGFNPEAGFSLSGTIGDGNSVTLIGTGFGTKSQAAPKVFDTFDIYYNNGVAETPYSVLNSGDSILFGPTKPYNNHVGGWTAESDAAYGQRSKGYQSPTSFGASFDYWMENWRGWAAPTGNKIYLRWYFWIEEEGFFETFLDGAHSGGATNITVTPGIVNLGDASPARNIAIKLDDGSLHRTVQSLPKISTTNFDIDGALPSSITSGNSCYVSGKDATKFIRIWDVVGGSSDLLQFSWTWNLYSAAENAEQTDTEPTTRAGGPGTWNLLELELFHPQLEVDVNDGVIKAYLNGILVGTGVTGDISNAGTWPFSGIIPRLIGQDTSAAFERWLLPNNFIRLAEIYADTTTQRIEIGDHATDLFQSTVREVCMLESWIDTDVGFIINRGELGSLAGKYLYIVDTNNVATLAGQFN